MKKNTKKRRTIRRLLIATAFALLMIPASVSADVVGKKITENYTPDRENPLSKIEYTYRSDGKFDMVLTFDILQRNTLCIMWIMPGTMSSRFPRTTSSSDPRLSMLRTFEN